MRLEKSGSSLKIDSRRSALHQMINRSGIYGSGSAQLWAHASATRCKEISGREIIHSGRHHCATGKTALACELDCAIASHPLRDERREVQQLFAEELLLALPPGHRLARKRAVCAADLEKEKFIVMKEGHCLGEQVLHFCERRVVTPGFCPVCV
jgi:hypothetical protein